MAAVQYYLKRVYHPKTTIGELWRGETLISYAIELPWRNNQRMVSCILEGSYKLIIRHSPKFGREMVALANVPGRTGILVHAGNDADNTDGQADLHGCIAPVTWVRVGNNTVRGLESTRATQIVEQLMMADIRQSGAVLHISNIQLK